MSYYLSIDAVQYPFEIPAPRDANFNVIFSVDFNVEIDSFNSNRYDEELIVHLVNDPNTLLIFGSSLFLGLLPVNLNGPGPYVRLIALPGLGADVEHGSKTDIPLTIRPSFQIIVEGDDYTDVRNLIFDLYGYLNNTTNVTITT